MNILFLKPDSGTSGKGVGPPLGLLYLISSLKRNGFPNVFLFDLTFSQNPEEDVKRLIKKKKPAIVGITINSHDRFQGFDLIRLVESLRPGIITVLGGPHATLCGESIIKDIPELDVLVLGDGELSMVELAEAVQQKKDFSHIKGIYYRDKNRRIIKNPPRAIEMNLDKYPFPDRSVLNIKDYNLFMPIRERPKAVTLISSRGCPFHCYFCAAKEICGGIIRFRSVDNILEEIKLLLKKFPDYYIFIYDDHFLLNKKRVLEFCKRVKEENLNFKWGCYGRVDSIDEEIAQKIAEAGCQMVSFGVESGSDYVLRLMNKKTDPKRIKKAIRLTKKNDIVPRCSIFFNYPGERICDIFKTFWMLWQADVKPKEIVIGEHTVIYPGTEIFYQLKDRYLPKDFNWEKKFENLPNYKNVPIYIPPFDFLRVRLIRFLRKFYKLYFIF